MNALLPLTNRLATASGRRTKTGYFVLIHGPLTRYVKLRIAHAPGMPGTFSSPPRVSDPDMHHGTCVTHVPWCLPGSLTSSLLWIRWRGKRSRHSRRMRNTQFYVSGKRPMGCTLCRSSLVETKLATANWMALYVRFWLAGEPIKILHNHGFQSK